MLIRKPVVSLGLALVLGLVAALFANQWIQSRAEAVEAKMRDGQPVVVAAREIPFAAQLREQDLKVLVWPSGGAPAETFSDMRDAVGKYSNQKLMPGEIVFRTRVVDQASGNSLSAQIEPNKRAITVRVNDVIGVGGFLLPGNRVDVLATRMNQDRRAETRILLENLKVLAVDQQAQADKDQPIVVRAVTLEVNPEQAELLVGATQEGTVQLALRNPEDDAVAQAAPKAKPAGTSGRPAAPPPSPQPTVTVIRQTQSLTSEVKP